MIAIIKPGAVIGGKDHKCIFVQACFLKSFHNLSHTPVNLHHDIPKQPLFRFPFKLIRHVKWYMCHRMRQVDKKWFFLVALNKIYCPFSKLSRKKWLVIRSNCRICYFIILNKRKVRICACWVVRPHIVRVGDTQKFIKSMIQRKELFLESKMPLPEYRSGISFFLKNFGNSFFFIRNTCSWSVTQGTGKANPVGIATGQ